jgi:hypothetical protein
MIVTAFNPDTADLERTYLSQTYAAGVSSFSVKNAQGFASSKAILLGKQGDERSEILQTSTVTQPNTIATSANSKFGHNADDPVYLLKYNQIKIYRATAIDGTYNVIATVDIDVDNAEGVTRYDDTAGLTTSYYKIKFYNSIDTEESEFSDPIAATGHNIKSAGKVIDAVVRRVRDTDYTILSVDEYLDIMTEVNDDLITQAHRPYRFLKRKIELNTSAGVGYIDLSTTVPDFWKFNFLEYKWTTGGVTQTYKIEEPLSLEAFNRKYDMSNALDDDHLLDVAIDEEQNRLLLGPVPKTTQSAVVVLHYYKTFDAFTSTGDLVETPNTLIYRYKMLAEFYSAKAETDSKWNQLATKYENKYGNEVVKMQRVNRVDSGTPRSFAPRKVAGYRRRFFL